jgi:hypothetical protein
MNTNGLTLGIAAALAALSLSAHAADSGFYIGVGGGQAEFQDDVASARSHTYKAFAGYRLKALPLLDFAAEGTYHYVGNGTHNALPQPSTYSMEAGSVAGLVILPIGPVDLFGKGGAMYSTLHKNVGGTTTSRSGNDAFYGAGVGFNIGSIGVRAEYEYFDVGNLKRMQAYTASLLIRF